MDKVPNRLRFMKTKDGYKTYVSKELNKWPIHTKARHNGTWMANIYRHETSEVVFQEIGQTRQSVALEAAEWLIENSHNLYMTEVLTEIEISAVNEMISKDENDMLSLWTGKDTQVVRDDDGRFIGLSVEQSINIDEEDYDDEDE